MSKMGRPALENPKKLRMNTSVTIESGLLSSLNEIAEKYSTTKSSFIQEALRDALEKPGKNVKQLLKK